MKFNILFYAKIRKSDIYKSVIMCRITYNKKRKQFSTGIFIENKNWDSKKQKIIPPDKFENYNNQLSLIQNKLYQAFLFLQVKGSDFTVEDIYRQYKGETPKKEFGIIEVYNLYLDRISKLIEIEIKKVTYDKYVESLNHLKRFVKWKFKNKDFELKKLKASFLDDYEYYLKTEPKLAVSTLNKAIQRFRRVVKYAISEEYLARDPFVLYKPKKTKNKIIYLTKAELTKLENYSFGVDRLERVKDMFIFCCYTGLGYKEMANLKKANVEVGFDGGQWIKVERVKTDREYIVPLLPQALAILKKYENDSSVFVLPSISNQPFNAYLKEIAAIVGIRKRLTHHIARKTFATTILLGNDVPMEIVSKLLGHSKLQTTQGHYGEIIDKRINNEIMRIKKVL